jgi:hypothetical protein
MLVNMRQNIRGQVKFCFLRSLDLRLRSVVVNVFLYIGERNESGGGIAAIAILVS